jgi:hypothetical protein
LRELLWQDSPNERNFSIAQNPVPRENKSSKSSRFWKIIEKFHPILACEYIGANAIAVVERPWLKVQAGFPPAFYQKKFAT